MDKNLTAKERELAELAISIGDAVDSHAELDGYWPEDLIPPLKDRDASDSDSLSSTLYTRQGDPNPKAGFTLHAPDGHYSYRVIIEPLP
jgi:hypothetical protein